MKDSPTHGLPKENSPSLLLSIATASTFTWMMSVFHCTIQAFAQTLTSTILPTVHPPSLPP